MPTRLSPRRTPYVFPERPAQTPRGPAVELDSGPHSRVHAYDDESETTGHRSELLHHAFGDVLLGRDRAPDLRRWPRPRRRVAGDARLSLDVDPRRDGWSLRHQLRT